eukprot:TRINITY_DN17986_c0_g2_i2.p2 TRINITY_DN17986_c0_g2~~TRINITY_DN17986_c0_g2_i2.p2  ORF type:complete len:248 (+),score=54.99 TRINITY_DN17986_c0_g2_i2:89-832(+)
MQQTMWVGRGSHMSLGRRATSRSAIKQQQGKNLKQQFVPPTAPPAPPIAPPPPPPPPEPPLATQKAGGEFPTRRDLFMLFTIGGGVWWWRLNQDFPGRMFSMEDIQDLMLYQTQAGNLVAAWQDDAGRFQLLDQAGNFYYDSQDEHIGIIMVDPEGTLTNMYMDEKTNQFTERIMGNIKDIELKPIDKVGNLRFSEPVYVAGFKDKTLPVFDPRGPLPSVISEPYMRELGKAREKYAKESSNELAAE